MMEFYICYSILILVFLELISGNIIYRIIHKKIRGEMRKEMRREMQQEIEKVISKGIRRDLSIENRELLSREDWIITEEEQKMLLGETLIEEKTEDNVNEKAENLQKAIEEEFLIEDFLREILSC